MDSNAALEAGLPPVLQRIPSMGLLRRASFKTGALDFQALRCDSSISVHTAGRQMAAWPA
jgi:hypothetical protein